jgi:hypothetical protein
MIDKNILTRSLEYKEGVTLFYDRYNFIDILDLEIEVEMIIDTSLDVIKYMLQDEVNYNVIENC